MNDSLSRLKNCRAEYEHRLSLFQQLKSSIMELPKELNGEVEQSNTPTQFKWNFLGQVYEFSLEPEAGFEFDHIGNSGGSIAFVTVSKCIHQKRPLPLPDKLKIKPDGVFSWYNKPNVKWNVRNVESVQDWLADWLAPTFAFAR